MYTKKKHEVMVVTWVERVYETASQYLHEVRVQGKALARHPRQRYQWGISVAEYEQVDPNEIQYLVSPYLKHEYPLSPAVSAVLDGEWDRAPVEQGEWVTEPDTDGFVKLPLEEYRLYDSMSAHFLDGVPWEQTGWYRTVVEREGLDDAGGMYTDVDTMVQYLHYLDELYQRIKQDGFRSQRTLSSHPLAYTNDVTVLRGRDGTYYAGHVGRHRLQIARLLDLHTIPVRVWVSHADTLR